MLEQSKIDLAKHRLECAKQDYLAAKDLLVSGHYKAANNRAYYSIFHSIRSILALEGIDFKKHTGVISYFNLNYIKSGVFDKKLYKIVNEASLIRNESDYSDFYIATKEEAEVQISNANIFYEEIYKYVDSKIKQ